MAWGPSAKKKGVGLALKQECSMLTAWQDFFWDLLGQKFSYDGGTARSALHARILRKRFKKDDAL